MNLDDNDPCSEHRAELVYEQLECREEQRVPQIASGLPDRAGGAWMAY